MIPGPPEFQVKLISCLASFLLEKIHDPAFAPNVHQNYVQVSKRNLGVFVCLKYPLVNWHSNGTSPVYVGNTSSNGPFSIAMLVYRSATLLWWLSCLLSKGTFPEEKKIAHKLPEDSQDKTCSSPEFGSEQWFSIIVKLDHIRVIEDWPKQWRNDPTKIPSDQLQQNTHDIPLYWLVNRDPYNDHPYITG